MNQPPVIKYSVRNYSSNFQCPCSLCSHILNIITELNCCAYYCCLQHVCSRQWLHFHPFQPHFMVLYHELLLLLTLQSVHESHIIPLKKNRMYVQSVVDITVGDYFIGLCDQKVHSNLCPIVSGYKILTT